MKNTIYLPFSKLYGYRAKFSKIEQTLRRFNLTDTVNILSHISVLLSMERLKSDPNSMRELQTFLEEHFIDDEIRWLISRNSELKLLRSDARPVFTRQQIQSLLRYCLLLCSEDSKEVPNGKTESGFALGRCCLMLNDYIFSDTELRSVTQGKFETKRKFIDLQITQNADFNNPPEIGSGLLRAWSMFVELLPSEAMAQIIQKELKRFHLGGEFQRVTNGLTLEQYLEIALMIYSWFSNQEREELLKDQSKFLINPSTYFKDFSVSKEDFNKYLSLDSIKLSDLIHKFQKDSPVLPHFDFSNFRRWPYIRFQNDNFTCADFIFLIEKLNEGVFWSIINSSEDKQFRKKAFDSFGYLFELYINRLLALSTKDKYFIPSPKWDDGSPSFDGIICDGGHITVLEYKSGFLTLEAKYSGNLEAFEHEIDEKFGRKRGVVQIVKSMERLFSNDQKQVQKKSNRISQLEEYLNSHDLRVEQVTPVLIVQDTFFRFTTAQGFLTEIWTELKNDNKIAEGIKVNPLRVRHANEILEELDPDYLNNKLEAIFEGIKKKYMK